MSAADQGLFAWVLTLGSGAHPAIGGPGLPLSYTECLKSLLAHPEWIPAVPWALANWVRGSFKLTGNCKTKKQAVPGANCSIALLQCFLIGLVCCAVAQVH